MSFRSIHSFRSFHRVRPISQSIALTSMFAQSTERSFTYTLKLAAGRSGREGNKKEKKYTKSNLPSKICEHCGRPMEWRKAWAKNWDEVKYCSDKCRKLKKCESGSRRKERVIGDSTGNYEAAPSSFPIVPILVGMIISAFSFDMRPVFAYDRGATRPSEEELRRVFDPSIWIEGAMSDTFSRSDFRRLDETKDSVFYTKPRFVEHIDKKAVDALTAYHSKELGVLDEELKGEGSSPRVLDLCSSWVSHLPLWYSEVSNGERTTVGLGMQADELARNPQLTSWVVQDLNENARLPFKDDSFDAVLCQLSIDYLINPVEVLKEASRVLRPDGVVLISFSNRVFVDKAVSGWTGKSDIDHVETVGNYIHFSGGFSDDSLKAIDVMGKRASGDPLYVVKANSLR